MDDFFYGRVGLVVSTLEWKFWRSVGVRAMVEETVGQGTAETLMEKKEQEGDFDAFFGEAIGVVVSVAL